jgi:hypothetical protein
LIYYCDMREALKHIYSNQITLEDKSQFYYTVKPYELTNMLGNVIAVLQEYHFTKKEETAMPLSCKLYKTKEGSWYDIEETKIVSEKAVLRMLKSAIDFNEDNTVLK